MVKHAFGQQALRKHTRRLLLGVGALLGPAHASAAALEEWQVGGHISGSLLTGTGATAPGAAAGADLQYGVTDTWALRGAVEAGAHDDAGDQTLWRGTATAGATYTVDIVRWLPFIEAGLCAARLGGGGSSRDSRFDVGAQIGVGADYLVDRRWAVAAVARYSVLPIELTATDGGGPPQLMSLAVRLSYRFD